MAVGMGPGYNLLWQDEMEATWKAALADFSISSTVPMVERDGQPVMVLGKPEGK
jgi:hypothetical protein